MDAYQQDLAYIHDTGFTSFVRSAAPALLAMLRKNRIVSGLVVDAGCGSGIWARELCRHGYQVLGIDISPAMIRLARKQAPEAQFRVGSLFDAKLPACDAVTCIGECVNYAFDPASGKTALARFFRRVHDALRPGGVFVFDIVEPGLLPGGSPQRRFLEGSDWAILLEVQEDLKRRTLSRRIVSFRQVGKSYRRSEEVHRLHLYPASELVAQLTAAGFEARATDRYGKFRLGPAHAVLIARKPALEPAGRRA